MAERPAIQRPVSPHLQIYRLTFTFLMSGFHRVTGVVLYGGFRPLPEQSVHRTYQTPPSLCEVHIFNPAVKQWRQVTNFNFI